MTVGKLLGAARIKRELDTNPNSFKPFNTENRYWREVAGSGRSCRSKDGSGVPIV